MGRPFQTNISPGDKFGKLTVLECVGYPKHLISRINYYRCLCECGGVKDIRRNHLTAGKTVSCGCYQRTACQSAEGESGLNTLYNVCKHGALSRGIEFLLTKQEHRDIIAKDCYYCGAKPSSFNPYLKKDGTPSAQKSLNYGRAWVRANGVDRFNNSLGYSTSNCVPCCSSCNKGKWVSAAEDYIEHCRAVVAFQDSKK